MMLGGIEKNRCPKVMDIIYNLIVLLTLVILSTHIRHFSNCLDIMKMPQESVREISHLGAVLWLVQWEFNFHSKTLNHHQNQSTAGHNLSQCMTLSPIFGNFQSCQASELKKYIYLCWNTFPSECFMLQQLQEVQAHRVFEVLSILWLAPVLQVPQIVDKCLLFQITTLS